MKQKNTAGNYNIRQERIEWNRKDNRNFNNDIVV